MARTSPPKKRRLSKSKESIDQQFQVVKAFRGNVEIGRQERLMILHVYFAIHLIGQSECQSDQTKPIGALDRTANLTGRGRTTVANIVKQWTDCVQNPNQPPSRTSKRRGNRRPKNQRIPLTPQIINPVRDFVMTRRENREVCTGREVMNFLIENQVLEVQRDETGYMAPKDYKSAIRSVQRFLNRAGFRRGKRTGSVGISQEHMVKLCVYIRRLKSNRALPDNCRLQEVYSDESYVHHHYRRDETSLFDPKDPRCNRPKQPNKGKRFCFICAIKHEHGSNTSGIVPNSEWQFCPKNSKGDYHKNFNAENYESWFKNRLLPNLDKPSLIILDNAKYHKARQREFTNTSKLKKAEVIAKLVENEIPHLANWKKPELVHALRNWIDQNIPLQLEKVAKEYGHEIVWSPPCFSDLNPIELVWAYMKKRIALQYSTSTSLKNVGQRLQQEFEHLYTNDGQKCVQKCIQHAQKVLEIHSERIDANDNENIDLSTVPEESCCSDSQRTVSDGTVSDLGETDF